jgi:hypothetical protein
MRFSQAFLRDSVFVVGRKAQSRTSIVRGDVSEVTEYRTHNRDFKHTHQSLRFEQKAACT